jgi:hypothetical protein
MNVFVNFQMLLKLALVLLMGLLPLHQLEAQENLKQKHQVHIKMIKEENGKPVVIDTTLTAASEEELLKAIKGVRIDTAHLRLLDGMKVRAYTLGGEGNAALRARVQGIKGDSAMLRALKEVRIHSLSTDSLSKDLVKRIEVLRGEGKSMTIQGNPQLYFRSLKDSTGAFSIKNGEYVMALNPNDIERIVVEGGLRVFKTDSLLRQKGSSYIKIITEGENNKIYRIERDGTEVEVQGEEIGLSITKPSRAIFIVRKAQVEDATKAEKEQLKATGAPVEMKSREELKVEEISYYPNPNNGRFNLKFTLKNKGTTVVRIMDEKGKEVFVDTVEKLAGEYERQIDLTPFGRGMYFLQVAQGGRYHTKKLLVQ